MLLSWKLYTVAAAGVLSHNIIFIHGEWHMQAPLIVRVYIALAILTFVFEAASSDDGYLRIFGKALLVISTYATSLFTSMTIYRIFFHRLRHFPGPFWAKMSKFWHVGKCIGSQNHLVLDALHKKYGDFVRTGPNELTIFDPEVFTAIDGPGSHCKKAVWYDFLLPEVAVNTTRDKAIHDHRRRIWDHGFTTKALLDYQDRIQSHTIRLEAHIAKCALSGESVDATSWFYWFSFDVMGEFAFARSFGMLQDEKWHHAVIMLRKAMSLLGPLSPVPWLAQIGFSLGPHCWLVKDWYTMVGWCKRRMTERIEMEPENIDVSSHLIAASKETATIEADRPWLNGDAIAIIIAGSDTVAPTLIFLFYQLALHPSIAESLYAALSTIDTTSHRALAALTPLNAIINETLRLHPPVPTGGYRETPPSGIHVANRYIPGSTTIVAPRYSIARLERCFEDAHSFKPERWDGRPEMVKDKRAYVPFSQGRYSCVGKQLALMELRFVVALLVGRYKVEFAGSEDGARVEGGMKDQFTGAPGGLELCFKRREEREEGKMEVI